MKQKVRKKPRLIFKIQNKIQNTYFEFCLEFFKKRKYQKFKKNLGINKIIFKKSNNSGNCEREFFF